MDISLPHKATHFMFWTVCKYCSASFLLSRNSLNFLCRTATSSFHRVLTEHRGGVLLPGLHSLSSIPRFSLALLSIAGGGPQAFSPRLSGQLGLSLTNGKHWQEIGEGGKRSRGISPSLQKGEWCQVSVLQQHFFHGSDPVCFTDPPPSHLPLCDPSNAIFSLYPPI